MSIFKKKNKEKVDEIEQERKAEKNAEINNSNEKKAEKKEEFVTSFDKYGRRVNIPKEMWKNNFLPEIMKTHWDNPAALYNDILSGIQNGLSMELKEAADHLKEIDPIKERAYTMLAITYMKCNLVNEAEESLLEFISTEGKTGTILTNLAKVYYAKDEKDKAEAVLYEGLTLDPNQNNGMPWYAAIQYEKNGEEGLINAFKEVAKVKNSWIPQVLLAREYLKKKNIDEAMAQYNSINEIIEENGSALATVANDLGRNGFVKESIEIVEPIYDVRKHGVPTGINLLQGYLMTKQLAKGEELLKVLMKLEVPEAKQALMTLSTEFSKLKAQNMPQISPEDVKVEMIVLNKPVWYYGLKNPTWLLHEDLSNGKVVLMPYSDITKDDKEGKILNINDIGRLTRSIPLYLSDSIVFNSNFDYNFVTPFADNVGPVVSKKPYSADALIDIGHRTGADFVVTGTISTIYNCIEVTNIIYDVKNNSFKKFEKLIERQNFGKDLNEMVNEVTEELCGENIDKIEYYDMPNDKETAGYITALGQQLTQTLVERKFVERERLTGERNILDWYLNLALADPKNEVAKIMLISGLAKSKEYGSDIYMEFKHQTINLLLCAKKESATTKMLPLVFKIFNMEKEFADYKEVSSNNSEDNRYKEWLGRL